MSESPRKKRSRLGSLIAWTLTAMLVVAIIAVAGYAMKRKTIEPEPPPPKLTNVEIITVQPREYREILSLPARVEADRTATISAELGGILSRWLVAEGSEVSEGTPVAELDTQVIDTNIGELDASLRTANKNVSLASVGRERAAVGVQNARKQTKLQELALSAAKSSLNLARIEHKRIKRLVGKKVMNQAQLDTVQNALTHAELAVGQAEEALASARLGVRNAQVQQKEAQANFGLAKSRINELNASKASVGVQRGKTILKAPIDGRIEEHLAQPGEVVSPGSPLARIYDLRHVRATVNVPDRYVAFIDPQNMAVKTFLGMNMPGARQVIRAWLVIPGLPKLTGGTGSDLVFPAEVARIAQSADPESNTFKTELRLPNPGLALRHGVIARGKIEYLHYAEAIVIPVRSVQVTDEGPRVVIVELNQDQKGHRVAVRDIDPISINRDQLLIGRGLKPGDQLIVAGWKGLVNGEAVNVLVADGRMIEGGVAPSVEEAGQELQIGAKKADAKDKG